MDWSELVRVLFLNDDQKQGIGSVLRLLNEGFARLCSRPEGPGAEAPIDALARYIVESRADRQGASNKLLALLKEPEADGSIRLTEAIVMEHEARSNIEGMLNAAQLSAWEACVPESLLDIDMDGGPQAFEKSLANRIDGLSRPEGFLCTSPFEYAHLQANGDVYPCCPSKFGKIIGNLKTASLEEIWASPEAEATRQSMLDGSYRYCNEQACEYLRAALSRGTQMSPEPLVQWAARQQMTMSRRAPKVVNFGFDRTCNLSCGYCRKIAFPPKASDITLIETIDSNIFGSALDDTERIILLGEGDPFASPFYREKLKHYNWAGHPRLRIKIQTNGLLLGRAMWNSIKASHSAIDWISVSIDAATKHTYALNRRGDFEMLLTNLRFISELLRKKLIRHFHINFLVQANNFREIPAFVALGKSLGCDLIEFQRLENWGTYTANEYRERAVHEPSHPDHAEFRSILKAPELFHPAVWLLKLADCVTDTASIDVVSYDNCL